MDIDCNSVDYDNRSLLHLAAAYGNASLVQKLIVKYKAKVNPEDNFGYKYGYVYVCMYVYVSAAYGNASLVKKRIVKYKAKVNPEDNFDISMFMYMYVCACMYLLPMEM